MVAPDVYRTLQVQPDALDQVLHSAFRTLARLYHPDGPNGGNPAEMSRLNFAYSLVRTPSLRADYDRRLYAESFVPVGPGPIPASTGAPRPSAGPIASRTSARSASSRAHDRLDFGRYQGWSLQEVAREDPDYLRWLSRHSSGIRYREQIRALLPHGSDMGRRASELHP